MNERTLQNKRTLERKCESLLLSPSLFLLFFSSLLSMVFYTRSLFLLLLKITVVIIECSLSHIHSVKINDRHYKEKFHKNISLPC